MIFEDDMGNRLSIPGEITVTILPSMLGSLEDAYEVKVWTLNPSTGVWVFSSDLEEIAAEQDLSRKKRQIRQWGWGQRRYSATLRGISINVQWFNFDAISRQTCIVKVRLFENDRYEMPLPTGRVYVVVQDSNGYNSLSTNRVSTDRGNANGFCMVTPCRSWRNSRSATFRGYLFADYLNEQLIPAPRDDPNNGLQNSVFDLENDLSYDVIENKIQVDFNQHLVAWEGRGPYYDWQRKWRYSYTCSGASLGENHFRFARETVSCLVEMDSFDPDYAYATICENLRLWYDVNSYLPFTNQYSPPLRRFWAFRTCYIKVLAPEGTRVEATSFIADDRHVYFGSERNLLGTSSICASATRDSDIYGVREDCATDGAVCLEVSLTNNIMYK